MHESVPRTSWEMSNAIGGIYTFGTAHTRDEEKSD